MQKAKLVQLVHIGKSQLQMSEESYRLLLQQFGKQSSKEMTEAELRQLVVILQQKGATIRLPFGHSRELSAIGKKLWATWKAMAKAGVVADGSSRGLNAYVQRILPNKAWHKLSTQETVQVLESLKQWQKRLGGKNG